MRIASIFSVLAWLLAAPSCLPADTRPEPATIDLQASLAAGSDAFSTHDGWLITINRALVGIGNGSVSDTCIDYADSRYDRLLDVSVPGDQQLNTMYALGHCAVRFHVSGPSPDTVVGANVSLEDKVRMGQRASDRVVSDAAPIGLDVQGTAQKGDRVKTFHWSFRQTLRYRDCMKKPDSPGMPLVPFDFSSAASVNLHIDLSLDALFHRDASHAESAFETIASADDTSGNADGEVTLEELSKLPLPPPGPSDYPYDFGDAKAEEVTTVEQMIYRVLVPNVAHFREPIACPSANGSDWQFD